ncbi:hypothetical protein [Spartinivicinus poritis]|uniref:CBM21 domain-containing protein n=1 Tax=Spartinivicinus poritis TaxID=2994640 RepID=A0ABT5U294_9GAMM|nr:hypothetical protein [Spartinivicinus sp. A2-2]MDE1460474.1 hypothetical protein [Spartinivicinus sp. A2-2]
MKHLPLKCIICFITLLFSSLSFAGQPVKLVKAMSSGYSFYGTRSEHQFFEILVERNLKAETVWLRLINNEGEWQDLPAKKIAVIDGHLERWQLSYQSCMRGTVRCSSNYQQPSINFIKFAVYANTATGQYWDNNKSKDYWLAKGAGWFLAEDVNVAVNNTFSGSLYKEQKSFYPQVLVRNIAHAKQVQVIYSFDSWLTSHTIEAKYQAYQIIGPKGGLVKNPSKYGVESWGGSIPVAKENQLAYFVRYKVDGHWYTDNNLGQNYRVTRKQ